MTDLRIPIARHTQARLSDLQSPQYFSAGASGMDLQAAIAESLIIDRGEFVLVPCGFCVAIPEGFEGQIRPRSGLANQHGITVLNAPGTIDCDYRGELKALLINLGKLAFTVTPGMRIAQLIVSPVVRVHWEETDHLPPTERSARGFGHTGH